METIAIVGSGPAGVAAAGVLVRHGLRPVLLDEGRQAGGQGLRRLTASLDRDPKRILGTDAAVYRPFHDAFEEIRPMVDHRPETLVWGAFDGELVLHGPRGMGRLPYRRLIIAAGATDRVMPVPGWTLPGVFTLGGAQTLLKDQGVFIGRRVVFAGSSPLMVLAARQYLRLGAEPPLLLDTTSTIEAAAAAPRLLEAPDVVLGGLLGVAAIRFGGVKTHHGVRLRRIEGDRRVAAVHWVDGRGREHRSECDAVALGHGLRSETQLAELAGCRFRYDEIFRQWVPEIDEDGRAGPDLFLVGDGAAIGGRDAAAASGELAALAILAERGVAIDADHRNRLRRRVARLRRFQHGLARAYRWPHADAATLPDDTVVCRCEGVTAGRIRSALTHDLEGADVNRVKAVTRCGMGRCQGRVCGSALVELTATAGGMSAEAAGRLRAQAPIKPIPAHSFATEAGDDDRG